VPTLGESVTEATVATWFKKPGDAVAVDEMLCELETDKVTVEVPSPRRRHLGEIVAAEGETVGVDALLATLIRRPAARRSGAAPPAAKPEAPQAPRRGGGESVDVMVPTLGESVTEATVSTWFKKVGDTVAQDEMLCELETDKVSVEVPAPAAGTLSEILAAEGTTVEAGGKLAVIGRQRAARAAPAGGPRPPARRPADGGKDVETPPRQEADGRKGPRPRSGQGTGRDGRIMKEDVLKALARPCPGPRPAAAPAAAPAPRRRRGCRREERVKMTRLRQTIARRLKDAQNTAAMLTTYNEVDMTEVMALRNEYKDLFEKKHGVRSASCPSSPRPAATR
jgi:2-oxoglutarate dehydrogenase E2 component (dihydrolipoamide succinyltransferase)